MATADVKVTEGSGKNVATYSVSEDTETKQIQRIALNDLAGVDILGTKVDAANIATDTTSVSGISLWKQISKSIQALVTANHTDLTAATPAGANAIGNVGGKTVAVTVVPTLVGTVYGTNYCVGGILTFANAMTNTGSGILQSVSVNSKKINSNQLYFVPFVANPTGSTFADNGAAAIAVADFDKARAPVTLNNSNILGTHTNSAAYGLGLPIVLGAGVTTLYGLLVAGAAFSSALAAGDLSVTIKILQDC